MPAAQLRQDFYPFEYDVSRTTTLPDPLQSADYFSHWGDSSAISFPRRHKMPQRICWGVGSVVCWSTIFVMVMLYIFIEAASLAAAFRSREIDNEVYELQNRLQREYARVAEITSPDMSRSIALATGLEKVTPERIDDLARLPISHIARAPIARVKDATQGMLSRAGASSPPSQSKDASRTVQIVLAPQSVPSQP